MQLLDQMAPLASSSETACVCSAKFEKYTARLGIDSATACSA